MAEPLQGRSRAGNAMARTRVAVLAGARQSLLSHGSKTTMVDIAIAGGVAKATLYNHFRTKSEVFAALIEHDIVTAATETAQFAEVAGPVPALCRLAERVGEHPVVRKLAATEPGVLCGLLLPELGAAGWETARAALTALVGDGSADVMLRYLVSQLLWPATRAQIEAVVPVLLSVSVPAAAERIVAVPVQADAPPPPTAPGLGFPLPAAVLERISL